MWCHGIVQVGLHLCTAAILPRCTAPPDMMMESSCKASWQTNLWQFYLFGISGKQQQMANMSSRVISDQDTVYSLEKEIHLLADTAPTLNERAKKQEINSSVNY